MPEQISPVDPKFYESVITKYSWWQTKDKERTFVVGSLRYDQVGDTAQFEPVTVVLIELLKDIPIERPWKQMVDLHIAGELIKVKNKQKQ